MILINLKQYVLNILFVSAQKSHEILLDVSRSKVIRIGLNIPIT